MAKVLVIADDLTGANACAAGFARSGLSAVTIGRAGEWSAIAEFHPRFDVVVVTTESRHSTPEDATQLIRGAVRAGWPIDLVCSRIDTTLRGNVGVSAQAVIDEVRSLSEEHVVGLCLPAHPAAGRVTVEGHQLLDGRRLEDTELVRDVRTPVSTSNVEEILHKGSSLSTSSLPLSIVTGPREALEAEIRRLVDQGADVVIADALDTHHLTRVAEAAVAAAPEVRWVAIDPGPGSLALALASGLEGRADPGAVLAVSGSATSLTQRQLQRLMSERDTVLVRPATVEGSVVPDVDVTVAAVVEAIEQAGPGQIVLVATVIEASDLGDLSDAESEAIPRALGRITRRVLQEVSVDGLYTTGGDITAAVLHEIDGQGLEIEDEVVPLAVAGEVVSGPWAGLPMVTKGGLVGDADSAVACLDHLATAAQTRRRFVRSAVSRETGHRSDRHS